MPLDLSLSLSVSFRDWHVIQYHATFSDIFISLTQYVFDCTTRIGYYSGGRRVEMNANTLHILGLFALLLNLSLGEAGAFVGKERALGHAIRDQFQVWRERDGGGGE